MGRLRAINRVTTELCVLAGVSIDDLGKQASFGGGCNRGRADGRLDWPISLAWAASAKLGIRCTPLRGFIESPPAILASGHSGSLPL